MLKHYMKEKALYYEARSSKYRRQKGANLPKTYKYASLLI